MPAESGAVGKPARKRTRNSPLIAASAKSSRKTVFLSYYAFEPLERISLIREGISVREGEDILSKFSITTSSLLLALNISPAQGEDRLLPAESERVLGMARLVGQVQAIVVESGKPEKFDAAAWMSRWLTEPLPALNGTAPLDLLDTMEGQSLVSTVLARVQSGAYT